jgi:tetratricopeptide (TPR) repeat protein
MVHIHPYVLIKMRDDPRMLESADATDRAVIMRMWRASRLASMRVGEIETRLGLVGVLTYDRAEFIEATKTRQSAWDIAEEWSRPLAALSKADRDFLGLAACELWRRLCPEHPSLEMMDDCLCEGYAFSREWKHAQAMAAWWKVWEVLRPRLTKELTNLADADERLFPFMSQFLSNWRGDFVLEAVNASLDDRACGQIGIRFIQELLEALPGEANEEFLSSDLAQIHFHLEHYAEAEELCQKLIHDHPDRAVGYVTLADGLMRRFSKNAISPLRHQQAVHVLERALSFPVKDADDYGLAARLADARESLSQLTEP